MSTAAAPRQGRAGARAAALATLARAMPEDVLQRQVLEFGFMLGWLRCHFRPARTAHGWRTAVEGDPGFCDVVLVQHHRLVLAELKSEAGRPSQEQRRWLDAMAGVPGVEVYLWRPMDWLTGRIQRVLSRGYDA